VTAYRAALEIYTRQHFPADWAQTQSNLSLALGELGQRVGGAEGERFRDEAEKIDRELKAP